jgi:starvation-inducible DNA-binding protein
MRQQGRTMSDNNLSSRLYPTRIDIPAEARSQIVVLLNKTLAATSDLKTQVKQAHWNVKGTDFYQLHELFDEIAAELEEYVDMIAERVTALGGYAMGTARMAAANSILPEYPTDILAGMEHVTALADRFAPYAKHLREAIDKTDELGDLDTADLYTEVSRTIDKRLWFLEAHLQAAVVANTENGNGNGNGNGVSATTKTQQTVLAG